MLYFNSNLGATLPWRFVRGDHLRALNASAIEQIGRNPGRPESVAVRRRTQLRLAHPPLDHAEHIDAAHAVFTERSLSAHRAPQWRAFFIPDPGRVQIFFGLVVGGDFVKLASLLLDIYHGSHSAFTASIRNALNLCRGHRSRNNSGRDTAR